jgi:hypothetical protein
MIVRSRSPTMLRSYDNTRFEVARKAPFRRPRTRLRSVGVVFYEQLPDAEAATRGHVRIIDESDEDYLYPQKLFATVELPVPVVRAIAA